VGVIYLVLIGAVIGTVLVVLLVVAGPNPAARAPDLADVSPGLGADGAWLAGLSRDEFQRVLAMLFEEMKFDVTPLEGEVEAGAIAILADDPTPLRGGKMLVLGLPTVASGIVDSDVVRRVLELVRGEEVGKGAVVTTAVFTDDARRSAESLPVDLVDGPELLRLVKKHLPQVAVQKGL
jgi:hypothetical protein